MTGPPGGPGRTGPPTAPTAALPAGPRPGAREVLGWLRRELPLLVVLAIAAYAFARIGLQHWREGTTELGLALLVGAGLRAVLADATAGLLAVRTRRIDVVTYAGGGLVVALVSLTITGGMLAGR